MSHLEAIVLAHLRRCPLSYREIEAETGVAASTLCRAVGKHRGLSVDALDRLIRFFKLELQAVK